MLGGSQGVAMTESEQLAKLRAFANEVMRPWPEYDMDIGELEEIAEKHGLLSKTIVDKPCGEICNCSDYLDPIDFAIGIECLRKTPLLTGESNDEG